MAAGTSPRPGRHPGPRRPAAPWGRDAARIPVAGASEPIPWTLPLHAFEAVHLTEVARTACLLVIAAVTGMRAGELMELTTAASLPPRETVPGLARYKLAGRVIKDQPHGGTPDEWVVIAEVHRAARLAASLLAGHGGDTPGQDDGEKQLLFGRFSFDSRYRAFRDWVNSPAGQRLGLAPIPGRRPRCARCGARWPWSSPTGPAASLPRNCT